MQPPAGFLLLTIQDCRLISSTGRDPPDTRGLLSLICVTLDVSATGAAPIALSAQPDRDVWLMLRIGNAFEMPISPEQTILHSRAQSTFTFNTPQAGSNAASVTLVVPRAQTAAQAEDIETLEVLLAQYGMLQEIDRDAPGTDGDLKGRLVLVDQDDGEYVGMLGNNIDVKEDVEVQKGGKDPVIVDVSEDGTKLQVHAVNPEEEDYILRSADYVSRGIVYAAGAIASGLSYAASQFVARTTPNPEPLVFSETTRGNVKRMHTVSGQAVQITAKTTGLIHQAIDKLAVRIGGEGKPRSANKKPRLLNRLLASTDIILSAVEQGAMTVIASGTQSVSTGVGHKYGKDAAEATQMFGQTAQNVSLVYVDARGVGRRALLRRMGKNVVKARLGTREIVLGGEENTLQSSGKAPPPLPARSATMMPKNRAPPLPPRSGTKF